MLLYLLYYSEIYMYPRNKKHFIFVACGHEASFYYSREFRPGIPTLGLGPKESDDKSQSSWDD